MCVILGMAFLALGIVGITGLGARFQYNPIYLSIAEIILGGLGFLVGVYARQDSTKKLVSQQVNDIDRQRQDIDQQRRDIEQQRKEFEQQKKEDKEKAEANNAS